MNVLPARRPWKAIVHFAATEISPLAVIASAGVMIKAEFLPAYLLQGFSNLHVANLRAAIANFDDVLWKSKTRGDQSSRDVAMLARVGRAMAFRQINRKMSLDEINVAIGISSKKALVYVVRGIFRAEDGHNKRPALHDFEEAVRLEPNHPDALREAANFLNNDPGLGRVEKAVEHARRAVEFTDARQWKCLHVYAEALARTGQVHESKRVFEQALELAPKEHLEKVRRRMRQL